MNFKSNSRFSVTTPNNQNFSDNCSEMILNDVLQLFESFVPISKDRVCHVVINPNHENPRYLDNFRTIILNPAGSTFYAQNVYQFAHELCHFAIHTGISDDRFKWFEEVICDISSHFFLVKMAEKWRTSEIENQIEYSDHFISYGKDVLKKFERVDTKELSNVNSDLYIYLSHEKYDRELNRFFTKTLLPIFFDNPEIWNDVPKLSLVKDFKHFNSFINNWYNLSSPDGKRAINKIKHKLMI